MSDTPNQPEYLFSEETINSLAELGEVLQRIYKRMRAEGYDIIDNKIIHLETGVEYEVAKSPKT